jgi:hypothetical protein
MGNTKQKSNIRLYVINPYQDGLGQGIFFLIGMISRLGEP